MKKYIIFITYILLINITYAEKYTIYWEGDVNLKGYSVDVSCVETGFGTMNRVSNIPNPEFTFNLIDGFNYTIRVIAYNNQGGYVISNTIKINTKNKTPILKVKPPVIKLKK